MKKLMKRVVCLVGVVACISLSAAPNVVLHRVQQRYPWNGLVDVDYEIQDVTADDTGGLQLELRFTDVDTGSEYVANKGFLSVPPVTLGRHRVTWNTAADDAVIYSTNVTVAASLKRPKTPPLYVVIDLSMSDSFGVNYLDAVPNGGWTDDYKTSKLVLRRIEAGQFVMGSAEDNCSVNPHRVTLSKPYYIGVFPVTYAQWKQVMGVDLKGSSYSKKRPITNATYEMIRGEDKGSQWPSSNDVDEASFIGVLRSKSGLNGFDLPTEAQWEFASKGGTDLLYAGGNAKDVADGLEMYPTSGYGTYGFTISVHESPFASNAPLDVGSKNPNPFGLYGCLGGVWEWCLDWYDESQGDEVDPVGAMTGDKRVLRGGSYTAKTVTTVVRSSEKPGTVVTSGKLQCTRISGNVASVDYGYFYSSGFRVCYQGEL